VVDDWLKRLQEGSQSVRDGLTACHYHVGRIEQIEDEIIEFCEARGELFREGHDTSFRMPSMSAEYAALQFALRLHRLFRLLSLHSPTEPLGNETDHSVRDQLAHHQAVEKAWFGVQRVQGELRIRYSSEVEDIVMDDDVSSNAFLTIPTRGAICRRPWRSNWAALRQ
jgi:hypothetical protein